MATTSPIIKKAELENYEKVLASTDFAIAFAQMSKEQSNVVKKIADFLEAYVKKSKYPQKSIDAQNFAFSKKQAQDIAEIAKTSLNSVYNAIESYVDKAISDLSTRIDAKDFMLSKSDLKDLKDRTVKSFREIVDKITSIKKDAKESSKPVPKRKVEDPAITAARVTLRSTVSGNAIKRLVSKQLFIPWVNFQYVTKFLDKNVFDNMLNTTSRWPKFKFDDYGAKGKLKITSFNLLFDADIGREIKAPFDAAQSYLTVSIPKAINAGLKMLRNVVVSTFKKFFPIVSIISVGFKVARIAFGIAGGVVRFGLRAINFAASRIQFVASTVVKVSSKIVKTLKASLDKISNLKVVKITAKGILAFFKTYAGAYVLGFILGRIVSRIRRLIDLTIGLKDRIVEIFTNAKNWWNENVQTPYIDPILEWLEKHFAGTGESISFYSQFFYDVLTDPNHSIMENVKTIWSIIGSGTGSTIRDVSGWVRKTRDWVENNLNGEAIKSFALRAGINLGVGLLGTYLGAAAGTLLTPFLGPFGPMLGALAGGWLADKVSSGIISLLEKVKINEVRSEESKLQNYIRTNFGGGDSYSDIMYGDSSIPKNVKLLKDLGKKSKKWGEKKNIEELAEAKEYKLKFGMDVSGTAGSFARFANIDTDLSYEKILNEVSSTLKEMGTILQMDFTAKGKNGYLKNTPIGMMSFSDITHIGNPENYLESNVALGGKTYELFKSPGGFIRKGINPYWAKVGRDLAILNAFRMLKANQISPDKFLDLATENIYEVMREPLFKDIEINLGYSNSKILDLVNRKFSESFNTVFAEHVSDWDKKVIKVMTHSVGPNAPVAVEQFLSENLKVPPIKSDIASYFPTTSSAEAWWKNITAVSWENVIKSGTIKLDASSFKGEAFSSAYDKAISDMDYYDIVDKDTVAFQVNRVLGENAEKKFEGITDKVGFLRNIVNDLREGTETAYLGNAIGQGEVALANRLTKSVESLLQKQVTEQELQNALAEALAQNNDGETVTIEQYSELATFATGKLQEAFPKLAKLLKKKSISNHTIAAIFRVPKETVDDWLTPPGTNPVNGNIDQ